MQMIMVKAILRHVDETDPVVAEMYLVTKSRAILNGVSHEHTDTKNTN